MGKRGLRAVGVLAVVALAAAWTAAAGSAAVVYDSIPAPLPGNVSSVGFEATSSTELGDHVRFAGTSRTLTGVTVTMSSWGCEAGHWYSGDCATTPGATFSHPVTLTLYAVDAGGNPGAVLAARTQTFSIPYRPSADATCMGGGWRDAGGMCRNGLAATVTFDFSTAGVTLPDEVIWGISYNTTHAGAAPIGDGAACVASSGGCGYDSLNVGTEGAGPSVGVDATPEGVFLNSSFGGSYCDGGTGGTGTFRLDDGCWGGFVPQARFEAASTLGPCLVDDDPDAKRKTLLADCTTEQTILVPQGYTLDGDGHTITAVDPAGGAFTGAVVQNAAGATSMDVVDLTVQGDSTAVNCGPFVGIRFAGASGSLSDSSVLDIRRDDRAAAGCQTGLGVRVDGGASVEISGNTITGYQKNGITVIGAAATITRNTVTGAGPVDYIAQNGIQVSGGASALIEGNAVSGNDYTPADTVACGLLFFEANGVKQRKNVLFANEIDICNAGRGGGHFNAQD